MPPPDSESDWVVGDRSGIPIPADPAALRAGGTGFLTRAFRASGALGDGSAVTEITQCQEVPGGSTGRKLLLAVEYRNAETDLRRELFVKFSRDLRDPARDRGKTQMAAEVRFAALSRTPGFPIAVPRPLFADYHRDTGTGILITERILFGTNGIEHQYHKCLDYEMPEPLEHYRALLTALGRLVGYHRSGRLPAHLAAEFPVDLQAATVGERAAVSPEQLERRLARLAGFTQEYPTLLPANVRAPDFLRRLQREAPRVLSQEPAVWRHLAGETDYVALCHWNANVDNAWFWRDADSALHCGLLDWGCVSQMNVAMAIWGALSGAETTLWNRHLDELLHVFSTAVGDCGGPRMEVNRLRSQIVLYAGIMGITWLLGVPALIQSRVGASSQGLTRTDSRIRDDEALRAPLQIFVNFLNLWQTHDIEDLLGGI